MRNSEYLLYLYGAVCSRRSLLYIIALPSQIRRKNKQQLEADIPEGDILEGGILEGEIPEGGIPKGEMERRVSTYAVRAG
jgi:hypothetical protein